MAKAKHVPRTDRQAEVQISRIGVLDREIASAALRRKEAIDLLAAKHSGETNSLVEERAALVEGLRQWAEAHRDRLTNNGKKKSAQFPTGQIAWKAGSRSVEISGDEASVIAEIEKRIILLTRKIGATYDGEKARSLAEERTVLSAFLRVGTTLNKPAMKDQPEVAESLAGVKLAKGEEAFDVKPLATQLPEVA